MNSVLAKTVSESQKDWDLRLPFVMSAYRATRQESTGYTPNFLVFGRENRAPPDIIFGSPEEEPDDSYDDFVEKVRERQVLAYSEVRKSSQQSAKRNKRYYDIGLKPKKFSAGEWVMYFNPRKPVSYTHLTLPTNREV